MLCKARRALCKTNCWREPGASMDHPTVNTACPTERWERLVAQEALGMHVIPHQKCAVLTNSSKTLPAAKGRHGLYRHVPPHHGAPCKTGATRQSRMHAMIGLQSDSWMYNVTPKHTVPLRMKVSLSCE